MKKFTVIFLGLIICLSFVTLNYARGSELLGAGATFPYPLYSKMFDVYHKQHNVRINFQAIGSGGGIRQLLNKTVDFGASDAFMTDDNLKKADAELLHIPICLGAVVVTYNVPGVSGLKFTPEVLSEIFLGKIIKWNDPKIAAANPGINIPGMKIIVVHRSDGSGTTFIFTDYLAKINKEWETKIGRGKSVNWPVTLGAKGNAGVAGMVKQIPGSLGYVEMAYATQNKMQIGLIQNKSGNFINPSLESTTLAGNIDIPDDTRVSITDTDSADGYPISGFTWILVYKDQNYDSRNRSKAEEITKLLSWMIFQGQAFTKPLHYAPLPVKAVEKAENIVKNITFNGEQIWKKSTK